MARIVPKSVFGGRGYQHEGWGPSHRTKLTQQWGSPEGAKTAVALLNTVGGAVANTVERKLERNKIIEAKRAESKALREAEEAGGNLWDRFKASVNKTTRGINIPIGGGETIGFQFDDAGDPEKMAAARLKAEAIREKALARESAALAYRKAAGAETMGQRRAATQDALTAYDRRRAATLFGRATGEGQQAITEDLKRLFPGRKPQRAVSQRRDPGLARDMEKDFRRSESHLRSGELAMKYQTAGGFSTDGFRRLNENDLQAGGFGAGTEVWIPAPEYLPDEVNQKLKSGDVNIYRSGLQEAALVSQRAQSLSDRLGTQLPERVKYHRGNHAKMARLQGQSKVLPRDHRDIIEGYSSEWYADATQGFDAAPPKAGNRVSISDDGMIMVNGQAPVQSTPDGGFVYPDGTVITGEDAQAIFSRQGQKRRTTRVGPGGTAEQADQGGFGGASDLAKMKSGGSSETPKPASKPKPEVDKSSAEYAASLKDAPRPKAKKKKRRKRRRRDPEELRKQLEDDGGENRKTAAKKEVKKQKAVAKKEVKKQVKKKPKPPESMTLQEQQEAAAKNERRDLGPFLPGTGRRRQRRRNNVRSETASRSRADRSQLESDPYRKEETVGGHKIVRKSKRSKKEQAVFNFIKKTPKLKFGRNQKLRRDFYNFAMKNGLEQAKVKFGFAQASAGQ